MDDNPLPRPPVAAIAVVAAALVAAFVVAPPTLAGSGSGGGFADERHLVDALREAFVEYWRSGSRGFAPDLQKVVDYWFDFHAVKAVIAAVLLVVLIALGVRLGRGLLGAGGPGAGRRTALASSGALVAVLALFSLAAVMANVQGVAAPFASLFPMLVDGATDGESVEALEQVRLGLAESPGAQAPPALEVMVSDFARFHAALAVVAATVAVVLVGTSVLSWKRFARTTSADRRARRVLGSSGVFSGLLSVVVLVIALANTSTAADPGPALSAFFAGGW